MDWLKQIPDIELLELSANVLRTFAASLDEFKDAKLHRKPGNEASDVRVKEAYEYVRNRRDYYDAILAELHRRGLR